MTTYQACQNYVLIELDPLGEEQLASGIVIPQHSDGDPQAIGRVVSAGPEAYVEIKSGVRVLFQPFVALAAWKEGDGMVLVKDDEIYAVIEEGKDV